MLVDIEKNNEVSKYMAAGRRSINLSLNGFLMDTDAPAIITCGDKIRLRYHINPGPNSQKLWISLYHSSPSKADRLTVEHPLLVGLEWSGAVGPGSLIKNDSNNQVANRVAITDNDHKWAAYAMVVFFLAIFLWSMLHTDILRDVPLPKFWEEAKTLRKELQSHEQEKWLSRKFPNYDPSKQDEYKKAAESAISGRLPSDTEIPNTLIGLLLLEPVKSPPRAAFSFARVQMGLWFCFAILSSIYLWIIYNDLVPIDNSILGLIGLSVSTGIISMMVDKDIPGTSSYFPSKGLFFDLITNPGKDEKPQIYRFQALIVNLLLLFIGILHIFQQLTFPTFDPTWLAFLGISGAAYITGKKVVEAK